MSQSAVGVQARQPLPVTALGAQALQPVEGHRIAGIVVQHQLVALGGGDRVLAELLGQQPALVARGHPHALGGAFGGRAVTGQRLAQRAKPSVAPPSAVSNPPVNQPLVAVWPTM